MKKIWRCILLLIFSLLLLGCSSGIKNDKSSLKKPKNKSLEVSGVWYSDKYEVLDKEISTKDEISEILLNKLTFDTKNIVIGNRKFEGINYKLKIVKSDYMISYEAEFNVEDLGVIGENVKVYSISYENNLLGEIIYINKEESYFYYQGILFNIKREENINESTDADKTVIVENSSEEYDKIELSQGFYIGLKQEGKQDQQGNYIRESYRTIWISTNKGEVQSIRQRKDIIFPRSGGIWIMQPQEYKVEKKEIYYEYFEALPIEKVGKVKKDINTEELMSTGKIVKKSLIFVGNNYIASEVTTNEKFSESPVYEVLPIDNLDNKGGVVIGDILGTENNKEFKESYTSKYASIDESNKDKLTKFINYSNYTVIRSNGKWVMQGRISPVLPGGKAFDYSLSIKPNKTLINYDTLIIPWKVLKGEIPFIVDAFTSPNGKLAVIVTKNELNIYKIVDGKLDKVPIKIIPLKDGEKVIMGEWCEGDYVDKWSTAFRENSSIID